MVGLFGSCCGAPSIPPVKGEEGVLVTALYEPEGERTSVSSNPKCLQKTTSDATDVSSSVAGRPSPASLDKDGRRDSSIAYSHDKDVLRQELKRRDMAMIHLKNSMHEETKLRERSHDQQRGFGAFMIARATGLEDLVSRSGERISFLEAELARAGERAMGLEAEAGLKDRELEELRESTGQSEGALLEAGRISHLESRLLQLEEENLRLRDRLMQRGAEMQGLAEMVEEAGGFVGDSGTQGKQQKQQQQQQPKGEKRKVKKRAASAGHSRKQQQPSRAPEAQLTPADKARRATAAVKAASQATKKKPSQQNSAAAAPSARSSANGPLPKSSSSKAKKAAPKSRAAAAAADESLFRVEACCEQCRASQGGCGWPAAVLSELRRCTGGATQASAFLSALAGAAGCKSSGADGGGLEEAQRMLETYTWGLKASGGPAAGSFDVYQALPHIVASCRFPAGLRSSAPAAASAFQSATPSSPCSEAASAAAASGSPLQWQAPTPSPLQPSARSNRHYS